MHSLALAESPPSPSCAQQCSGLWEQHAYAHRSGVARCLKSMAGVWQPGAEVHAKEGLHCTCFLHRMIHLHGQMLFLSVTSLDPAPSFSVLLTQWETAWGAERWARGGTSGWKQRGCAYDALGPSARLANTVDPGEPSAGPRVGHADGSRGGVRACDVPGPRAWLPNAVNWD